MARNKNIFILIILTVAFEKSNDADNAQTNTILEENNIDGFSNIGLKK